MWFFSVLCRPKATRESSPWRSRPRLAVEALEERAAPAVFSVTSLADSNAPGSGALRAAITASNATAGPNEIDLLTPGTYKLTLVGTPNEADNSAGELSILNHDVTLVNRSGGAVVIDAAGLNTRVLDIRNTGPGLTVTLTGLTIQGGNADTGGGIQLGYDSSLTLNNDIVQNNSANAGGGIGESSSSGVVTLNGTAVRNNRAGYGGGIDFGQGGFITLMNSSVTNNQAGGIGGGIAAGQGTDLTVTDSIVSGNSQTAPGSTFGGGGIFAGSPGSTTPSTVTVTDSVIAQNTSAGTGAGNGGGGLLLDGAGDLTITGSEFSGNTTAADGGGLLVNGPAALTLSFSTFNTNTAGGNGGGLALEAPGFSFLTNVTISGNSADTGGGLFKKGAPTVFLDADTIVFNAATTTAGGAFAAGEVDLSATIVAKNTAPPTPGSFPDVDNNSVTANLQDGGGNFIGDNTGAADSFPAGTPNPMSYVGTGAAPLDPLLDPLADSGGSDRLPDGSHLLTHQDQPNSGPNGVRGRGAVYIGGGSTDARGFPRPNGGQGDVGAFEYQNFDVAVSAGAPAGPVRAGLPATFTLTVTNLGPNTSQGVTLTATLPAGTAVVGASGSPTISGNVVTFAVPDLPSGGSATFTLTVIPAAPGPFTTTATVSGHDDPNLANNTAAVSLTVLPRPATAAGSADVTALVQVVRLGHRRRPQRRLVLLLTNISGVPILGPLALVVAGLPRGVRLRNAGGLTAGQQPFVLVNIGSDNIFDPGASVVVQLVFSRPFRLRGLSVLAGAFA
jgi:uncharacterized repeat protein (TIGR01451 family)